MRRRKQKKVKWKVRDKEVVDEEIYKYEESIFVGCQVNMIDIWMVLKFIVDN